MIITGKNVEVQLDSVARTLANTISVNFDGLFLVFRDYQGKLHYYDKKPKITGEITEFIDDLDTLNDFILSTKISNMDIITDIGTKKRLRLKDVVFVSFDFGISSKGLTNASVNFRADDYEILVS